MKKIRWLILVILLIIVIGSIWSEVFYNNQSTRKLPVSQVATIDRSLTPKEMKLPIRKTVKVLPNIGIEASSVILINAATGDVLYDKNSDQALPTASMSKMMTEFLVLEAIKNQEITWDQTTKISDYAYFISNHPGFATVKLKKDKLYTIRALFHAMAIRSANGAAIALAEAVAGSEKNFVMKMNTKAKHLGLKQSHFVNSTGLNNTDLGNYYSVGSSTDTNTMSAIDVALLAQQLIKQFPDILEIVDEPHYTFGHHTYTNTNWMLPEIDEHNVGFTGVDGLKTGYTNEAGYCFVGTVKRKGVRLISVVMGTSSIVERFSETRRLYEIAFKIDRNLSR